MSLTENDINLLIAVGRLRNSENDVRRIPIDRENSLNDLVRQGRYQEIHVKPYDRIRSGMGTMAKDEQTQFTYMVVAFITAWSRIAIEEGVLPSDSFDLSDALLYQLSFATTHDQVYEVYKLAPVMFAKKIHLQKSSQSGYQTERVKTYISRNIYRKITLNEIAAYMNMTPNYLCSLFSHQTGMTIHNYIQREKIELSCNLLRFSDRPISDVATYMGFQTQSNFALIFRKWKNMTPSEYRTRYFSEVY